MAFESVIRIGFFLQATDLHLLVHLQILRSQNIAPHIRVWPKIRAASFFNDGFTRGIIRRYMYAENYIKTVHK